MTLTTRGQGTVKCLRPPYSQRHTKAGRSPSQNDSCLTHNHARRMRHFLLIRVYPSPAVTNRYHSIG